jgi:predicted MFS family arabinose efflux permease
MLEDRLQLDAEQTQSNTTKLLAIYGLVSLLSAPITAHIADRLPNRRAHLLIALFVCIIGSVLVASTLSGKTNVHKHIFEV